MRMCLVACILRPLCTDICFRLHSIEARTRMQSYRIGRIEGRWDNFIPPIQGGKFRKLSEVTVDEKEELLDSAEASSGQSTPDNTYQRRKADHSTPPSS